MNIYKYPLFILLGLTARTQSCLALQTYPLIDHQRTTLTISNTDHNRIAVMGARIQQIFGAEGSFDLQSDEEGGQIFLKLHSPSSSKSVAITIITESGLTQDLKLIPKPIESQSILFKLSPQATDPGAHLQEQKVLKELTSQSSSLINLMIAMAKNETLEGYTKMSLTAHKERGDPSLSSILKISPLFLYKGNSLEGKVYTLTNQGKAPIQLKEPDFTINGDLAITLSRKTLHPNEAATLYVASDLTSAHAQTKSEQTQFEQPQFKQTQFKNELQGRSL